MAEYIDPPISADYDAAVARALDATMAAYPGWTPREGDLLVWTIEVLARMNVETADLASRTPSSIFRYFGESLLNIAPIDAAAARVRTTWTLRDSLGHTIPAGVIVAFNAAADQQLYFQVETSVVVAPGDNRTSDGEVSLVATDTGAAANEIAASSVMTLVDALAWVNTITTTAISSGGIDPESDGDYLNRLKAQLRLLTPRPILPDDFAVLAQDIPGVGRALGIDGYNPTTNLYNQERVVTVAIATEDGLAVPTSVKNAVVAYLDALREVNFMVFAVDPVQHQVDVTATVKALPGADLSTVQNACVAALRSYLSPASWDWSKTGTDGIYIRRNELVSLLDRVAGVDYVVQVVIPPYPGDMILPRPAPLPNARNISVTVS